MDNINKEMEIMEMEHDIRITREDFAGRCHAECQTGACCI